MSKMITRRDFIQRTGMGLVGLASLGNLDKIEQNFYGSHINNPIKNRAEKLFMESGYKSIPLMIVRGWDRYEPRRYKNETNEN